MIMVMTMTTMTIMTVVKATGMPIRHKITTRIRWVYRDKAIQMRKRMLEEVRLERNNGITNWGAYPCTGSGISLQDGSHISAAAARNITSNTTTKPNGSNVKVTAREVPASRRRDVKSDTTEQINEKEMSSDRDLNVPKPQAKYRRSLQGLSFFSRIMVRSIAVVLPILFIGKLLALHIHSFLPIHESVGNYDRHLERPSQWRDQSFGSSASHQSRCHIVANRVCRYRSAVTEDSCYISGWEGYSPPGKKFCHGSQGLRSNYVSSDARAVDQ